MDAISMLPAKTKHLVIGIVAITGIGLFGLSVYGSNLPATPLPTTIIAPAPEYSAVESV